MKEPRDGKEGLEISEGNKEAPGIWDSPKSDTEDESDGREAGK
jgi:hypothetical protein